MLVDVGSPSTATLDAAPWGAELAVGEGPGRIYRVEPAGPFMDDPNLTDKKFTGSGITGRCARTDRCLRKARGIDLQAQGGRGLIHGDVTCRR